MAHKGVYILGSSELGWYKIGRSHDLLKRVASYKTLPFRIDVQHMWLADNCDSLEHALHARVWDAVMHVNGSISEWFNLSDDALRELYRYLDAEHNRLNPVGSCVTFAPAPLRRNPAKRRRIKSSRNWPLQPVSATFVQG